MINEMKHLTAGQRDEIIEVLKLRFLDNMDRHKGIEWEEIKSRVEKNNDNIITLHEMEATGGEPDVVLFEDDNDSYTFVDCSPESPLGRRNVCYDREALEKRKKNKPQRSAMDFAFEMGIEILTEDQYRQLQKFGEFDTKTSSWIKTPDNIRKLGGAVFCDRRYDTVFMYHNGADSYYSARGFRGLLKV